MIEEVRLATIRGYRNPPKGDASPLANIAAFRPGTRRLPMSWKGSIHSSAGRSAGESVVVAERWGGRRLLLPKRKSPSRLAASEHEFLGRRRLAPISQGVLHGRCRIEREALDAVVLIARFTSASRDRMPCQEAFRPLADQAELDGEPVEPCQGRVRSRLDAAVSRSPAVGEHGFDSNGTPEIMEQVGSDQKSIPRLRIHPSRKR